MAVRIGSARIDENGKARGGKAGDQTGKEVSTQNWYKHNKGWRVFRAKDPKRAEMIAQDMQWACDNKHIVRCNILYVDKNIFNLCREYVDTLDNKHIISSAHSFSHSCMSSSA